MSIKLAGDVKSGNIVMVDNLPVIVLRAEYNKSGRNAAVVKFRFKNLMTNRISEVVHKADVKMEAVILEKKDCKYSYFSEPNHVFVDGEYNEYEVDKEGLADIEKYLVAEMTDNCQVTFYEGRALSVVLPQTIIREIEYTEPAARGDTSGKVMKAAVLKGTKHELQVSGFVEIGDMVEIDTTTGDFKRRCT